MVLGFLCAGIFSGEFQLKANAVFYSSYYGRNKAVWAKVKAGAIIITAIYWAVMLLYTMLVLGILGVDGANCPICNIREKIEDDPGHPVYIQTVRGVGYRFNGNLGSE